MDFHLKQCRNQHESEEQQHSAKISKFVLEQRPEPTAAAPLPLFVPDPTPKSPPTFLSAFPDSSSSSRFPRTMWGYFSVAQRQELELQALIFRYMLAGAAVPPELLHPIKKSLLSSTTTPFLLHHQHFPHYPTSWYWGRAAMDPEPGRCRRTDGKKWRCSRDVVANQKYCERHMHRGRNRSRKPVETTTTTAGPTAGVAAGGGSTGNRATARALQSVESGNYFSLSGQSPSVDVLHLNQGACSGDGKPDSHILRHFFDDYPRSLQQPDNGGSNRPVNPTTVASSPTALSISIAGNPPASDVSLKLSTGSGEEEGGREQMQMNWAAGWAATQITAMGGPLAEALRSANNSSSPTSVLPRASVTEGSFISTLS